MAPSYDPRIETLSDVERALVEAELNKNWEDMDADNCTTELGKMIVKHAELYRRLYDYEYC